MDGLIVMYCKKCGGQNADNVKFCKYCGSMIVADNVSTLNTESIGNVTAVNKKKSKNKIIVILAMVCLFIVVLAIVFLILIGRNNSNYSGGSNYSFSYSPGFKSNNNYNSNISISTKKNNSDSNDDLSISESTSKVEDNAERLESESNATKGTEYIVDVVDDFVDGMALIKLSNSGKTIYYGCVDTNGDLHFIFPAEYMVEHSGGYIHILNGNANFTTDDYKVIDSSGNVSYSIHNSDENKTIVLAGGNGYTAISEQKVGFENSERTYSIVDSNGDIVFTYDSKGDSVRCTYRGSGVFQFDDDDEQYYYSTEGRTGMSISGDWREKYRGTEETYYFKYGAGVFGNALYYANGLNEELPFEFDYIMDGYEDGIIVYSYENTPYVYNCESKQSYPINQLQGHKVIAKISGGLVGFEAPGDDNKGYFMVVDKDGNIIKEISSKPEFYYDISFIDSQNVYLTDVSHGDNQIAVAINGEGTSEFTFDDGILMDNYYNGWAKCKRSLYDNVNFKSESGDFMFKEDSEGRATVYVDEDVLNISKLID